MQFSAIALVSFFAALSAVAAQPVAQKTMTVGWPPIVVVIDDTELPGPTATRTVYLPAVTVAGGSSL
ncbi:hypothetical protein BDN72DRAFT_905613 [Pluteus cervinus]|uniref:Uncharacterized protein n=1 Tax=Pluteus cervinus TaxID=181527 RepID=A0ACD3A1V2_9AGAR|nr:hypothetical protein BDN72DRAFT_905613 [Pluteus cervinus]